MHWRLAALALVGALGCSAPPEVPAPRGSPATSRAQTVPDTRDTPVVEPSDPAARAVFGGDTVKTYALTVDPGDLAKLNQQPSAEAYVPAVLQVEGTRQRVALRYKGSVGAFLPPCTGALSFLLGPKEGKCSFKLAFDEYDADARFHGLKKLNLHSMTNDPSMMLEQLTYGFFREMGIAASRTAYVRVTINDVLEGLFVAVEEPDGRFTRSRFPEDGEGNLYKEVWPLHEAAEPYRSALETNKKDGNVEKMRAFAAALRNAPAAAVEAHMERQYMLRYLAVDRVIMNDDGPVHLYCVPFLPGPIVNHNYLWYEAEHQARFWLVPWDLDHALRRGMRTLISPVWWKRSPDCACASTAGGLFTVPSACDPLLGVFADARSEYEAAVDAFLNGPFSAEQVDAKLHAWTQQIAPYVAEASGVWGAPSTAQWQRGVAQLREDIATLRHHRGHPYE